MPTRSGGQQCQGSHRRVYGGDFEAGEQFKREGIRYSGAMRHKQHAY